MNSKFSMDALHVPPSCEPLTPPTPVERKIYTPPRLSQLSDLDIQTGNTTNNAEATGGLWSNAS